MTNIAYSSFMHHAISLAEKSAWKTAPNPSVGAVLLHNGSIVAQGWHKGAGHPHAEIEAIAEAREKNIPLHACTLVVTLEPCHHTGKTLPCTRAILEAGIKKIVVGANDPNPKASGGIDFLQSHGIEVITGVAQQECLDLIDDFSTWIHTDIPYVITKLASTLDGRIATRTGDSKWITSVEARHSVHQLRKKVQAIIVGGNTFYLDNPQLTWRLENENPSSPQPLAVVVTSRLPQAQGDYFLLKQRPESTVFWTTVAAAASPRAEELRRLGVRVTGLSPVPYENSFMDEGPTRFSFDFSAGLSALRSEYGCHYVMCEGGGKLALSLLQRNLSHELHLYFAPKIIGDNKATPLFDGNCPDKLIEALQLRILETKLLGTDVFLRLKPSNTANE